MESLRYANQKNPSHWHRNAPQVRTPHSWWQTSCPSTSRLQLTKPMGGRRGRGEFRKSHLPLPPSDKGKGVSYSTLTAPHNERHRRTRKRVAGSASLGVERGVPISGGVGFAKSLDVIVFYVKGAQTTHRGTTRI